MNSEIQNVIKLLDKEIEEYEQIKYSLDTSGKLAIDLKICALDMFRKKVLSNYACTEVS